MMVSLFLRFSIVLIGSNLLAAPLYYQRDKEPIVRKVISTPKAAAPVAPYSQAIQIGNLLYVTGEIGINPATSRLVKGGTRAEAIQIFKNIEAILAEAGIGFDNVVKVNIQVTNLDDLPGVNEEYVKHFNKNHYPARATGQVVALPENASIMIETIAVVNDIIESY